MAVKQAFGSPGGKTRLAPKIIPMFISHRIYVEPFAGGAAVYFRKDASEKEVLNDKDAEIAFAFRFLANMTPEQFKKLDQLYWIKSERRFRELKAMVPRNELERFYRFYYLKKASFARGSQSFNQQDAGNRIGTDHLWRVHERLRRTRVHNTTALKIIDKYDSPSTLFYLDPPYPGRAFIGSSFGEYTVDDLKELIQKLKGIEGKFILSLSTEHQKYLPLSWFVRRLKLRRNIPSWDSDWNQSFQFEIVAANYDFTNPSRAYRRSKRIVPIISAKEIIKANVKMTKEIKIRSTRGVMMEKAASRRRRGRRRGSRRQRGGYTHPGQVPGVILRTGGGRRLREGRPRIVRKLKKGAMNNIALSLGYIDHGQTISDIPKSKMDDFARDLVNKVGAGRAMKMVQVQINFRQRSPGGFKDKMIIAKNTISRESKVLKVRH